MADVHASADKIIVAPADKVYRILADYKRHHPRILSPDYSDLTIEEGGFGEGTVVRFQVKAGASRRAYRMTVTEPMPGRILTETDSEAGTATTFVVTQLSHGSRVEIGTVRQTSGGLAGVIERFITPGKLKRLHKEELNRLDDYAQALSA